MGSIYGCISTPFQYSWINLEPQHKSHKPPVSRCLWQPLPNSPLVWRQTTRQMAILSHIWSLLLWLWWILFCPWIIVWMADSRWSFTAPGSQIESPEPSNLSGWRYSLEVARQCAYSEGATLRWHCSSEGDSWWACSGWNHCFSEGATSGRRSPVIGSTPRWASCYAINS